MPARADSEHVWLIGVISLVVAAITVVLVVAVARSERLARGLGRVGQRCVNPLRRLFHKPPVTAWPDRAQELRTTTLSLVEGNARVLGGCIGGGYLLNGFLLVGCLWACGIEPDVMPVSLGLVLYSIGRLADHRPDHPRRGGRRRGRLHRGVRRGARRGVPGRRPRGGAGVPGPDLGFPLVTGAFAYVAWRIMRHREIHELADAEPH